MKTQVATIQWRKVTKNWVWYLLLVILAAFFFIPFWWMIATSFKTYSEVYTKQYSLIPTSFRGNFKMVSEEMILA
jgi:ABC-type glycerol-3-phosphate transport system permease component